MPEMIVWPVSSLTFARNVGSCLPRRASVSSSFFLSAEDSGSTAIEITVSGNAIVSSRIGFSGSHNVSPVTVSFMPMTPTMSPATASSILSRRSAWMCHS